MCALSAVMALLLVAASASAQIYGRQKAFKRIAESGREPTTCLIDYAAILRLAAVAADLLRAVASTDAERDEILRRLHQDLELLTCPRCALLQYIDLPAGVRWGNGPLRVRR